jgi:hypothetical protein
MQSALRNAGKPGVPGRNRAPLFPARNCLLNGQQEVGRVTKALQRTPAEKETANSGNFYLSCARPWRRQRRYCPVGGHPRATARHVEPLPPRPGNASGVSAVSPRSSGGGRVPHCSLPRHPPGLERSSPDAEWANMLAHAGWPMRSDSPTQEGIAIKEDVLQGDHGKGRVALTEELPVRKRADFAET